MEIIKALRNIFKPRKLDKKKVEDLVFISDWWGGLHPEDKHFKELANDICEAAERGELWKD